MASKELTALSVANTPKVQTSVGMETPQETVARAQKMLATPKIDPTKVGSITPETLSPTPVINVPTPATPTAGVSLQSDLMAQQEQADAFTKAQTEAKKQAEAGKNTALADYLAGLKQAKGLTTLQAEAYAAPGGVNEITPELNAINDQIRQEQRSLDLAKRAITEKGGGLKMGAAAEISNLERVSLEKQADLSIIQMALQGRYDSAKEIADRAVKAKFEQQQIYTDALKFAYDESKDIFTKNEQREFETLLGNRNRALQEAQDNASAIKNFALTALQSGAPTSVAQKIMGAKTLDEAIALGGDYLRPKAAAAGAPELKNFGTADNPIWKEYDTSTGSWVDVKGLVDTSSGTPLKKVTDKEVQDLNESKIATDSLNKLVDTMVTSIQNEGTKVFWGSEAGKRGSAKTQLLLAMKNLEKTGALDTGTINVLSQTIPDNEFWATEDRQVAALNELKTIVNDKTNALIGSYRGTTAETDPRTNRIYEQFKPKLNPDDSLELDQMFGTNTSTAQFNPGSYFQ